MTSHQSVAQFEHYRMMREAENGSKIFCFYSKLPQPVAWEGCITSSPSSLAYCWLRTELKVLWWLSNISLSSFFLFSIALISRDWRLANYLVHSVIMNECQKMIMCLCVAVKFPNETLKHLVSDSGYIICIAITYTVLPCFLAGSLCERGLQFTWYYCECWVMGCDLGFLWTWSWQSNRTAQGE